MTNKDLTPTEQDLIEMKAEELIEDKKEELRKKAEEWSEKKGKEKAIKLFEEEKQLSNEMKQFKDQQVQLNWMFEQGALPE